MVDCTFYTPLQLIIHQSPYHSTLYTLILIATKNAVSSTQSTRGSWRNGQHSDFISGRPPFRFKVNRPLFYSWSGVVLRPLTGLMYQSRMRDGCVADRGMRTGRGLWGTRKNSPHCHSAHHKSHIMTWDRTMAAAVGSRRLTASAMAWSSRSVKLSPGPAFGTHSWQQIYTCIPDNVNFR
jgi:hypothetical protein